VKCVVTTSLLVSTGVVSCCDAILLRRWTSSGSLMKNCSPCQL